MKKFSFFLFVAITFFSSSVFAGTKSSTSSEINWGKFDYEVTKAFNESSIPGAAIAVVRSNKIMYIKPFGLKQLEDVRNPVDTHTIFRIASMSKGMTAFMIVNLISQHELELTTPLYKILPNFHFDYRSLKYSITIQNLLTHTSGFSHHIYDRYVEKGENFSQIKERLAKSKQLCRLSKCHAYQNTVYNYLQDVIQEVTKKTFEQKFQEVIAGPLNMHDTSIGLGNYLLSENKALPSLLNKYGKYQTSSQDMLTNWGSLPASAGVNSSISDMATWLRAQLGGFKNIVTQEELDLMRKEYIEIKFSPDSLKNTWEEGRVRKKYYGLGWRIYDYMGEKLIIHGGLLNGYNGIISYMPEKDYGIVILTNASPNKWAGFATRKFWDMLLKIEE